MNSQLSTARALAAKIARVKREALNGKTTPEIREACEKWIADYSDALTGAEPFTPDMAMTLTPKQIEDFWEKRQRFNRAEGKPHYTELRDGKSGELIRKIGE